MSKELPNSFEAEQGALGSILQDAKILALCTEESVTPSWFYHPEHRTIFEAMIDMGDKVVDLLTVADKLRDDGDIKRIGGEVYLHKLVDATPTTAHVHHYIRILETKHKLRKLIKISR